MTERVRGEEALIFSELHFCFVHLLPAISLLVRTIGIHQPARSRTPTHAKERARLLKTEDLLEGWNLESNGWLLLSSSTLEKEAENDLFCCWLQLVKWWIRCSYTVRNGLKLPKKIKFYQFRGFTVKKCLFLL